MDPNVRRQQRKKELEQRHQTATNGPAAIGQRTATGRYDVLYPDGGVFPGLGVKVFNSAHEEGDTVVAIPRQDGSIALEGPKASIPPPNIFKDPCGDYLGGQVFSCPVEPADLMILWALGRRDVGGENGFFTLHLINLKTGTTYAVGEWSKKIQGCPIEQPNAPPPPATPPPSDPDGNGLYRHVWHQPAFDANANLLFSESPHCSSNYRPPFGSARLARDQFGTPILYTTYQFYDQFGNRFTWFSSTNDWLTNTGDFIARFEGFTMVCLTDNPVPPALPPLAKVSTESSGGISTSAMVYVSTPSCPTVPGENPPYVPPRDPSKPPINNVSAHTLSLDPQRRPIVHFRHSPNCRRTGFDVDKYFRLEPKQDGSLGLKAYPGNSKMKDWRFDLPEFPCKTSLKSNQWISFEIGRSWAWQAEASVTEDGKMTVRPATMTLNAPYVEIKVTKSKLPDTGCVLPSGGSQPRKTIRAIYRGQSPDNTTPAVLTIVALAAYSQPG